jgi:hypothetical protein
MSLLQGSGANPRIGLRIGKHWKGGRMTIFRPSGLPIVTASTGGSQKALTPGYSLSAPMGS